MTEHVTQIIRLLSIAESLTVIGGIVWASFALLAQRDRLPARLLLIAAGLFLVPFVFTEVSHFIDRRPLGDWIYMKDAAQTVVGFAVLYAIRHRLEPPQSLEQSLRRQPLLAAASVMLVMVATSQLINAVEIDRATHPKQSTDPAAVVAKLNDDHRRIQAEICQLYAVHQMPTPQECPPKP